MFHVENVVELEGIISTMIMDNIINEEQWQKFNLLDRLINSDSKCVKDDNIDWNLVNEIVKPNNDLECNLFGYIDTIEKFDEARLVCIGSTSGFGPLRKEICIQCGKEFYLDLGEVKSYKNKGFELPKRCKPCRDRNKDLAEKKKVIKEKNDIRFDSDPYDTAFSKVLKDKGII